MFLCWNWLWLWFLLPLAVGDNLELNDGDQPFPMCRHKRYLPAPLYEWDTCAYCYKYMPDRPTTFGLPSRKLLPASKTWVYGNTSYSILTLITHNGSKVLANASDEDNFLFGTFVNDAAKRDWTDCCLAAKQCCQRIGNTPMEEENWSEEPGRSGTGRLCPATWDGWQCWDATEPDTISHSFCPPYIYFLTEPPSCAIPLEKECAAGGEWKRRPNHHEEWTNYGGCGTVTVSLQLRRAYVLISAYLLSIIAILPALAIFFAYKQLRVHRIILHQNLFLSMAMNAILVITFKAVVMINEIQHTGISLVEENSVGCRVLLILTKYSRMTNYMWMFCEGFYLHKLIAAAFAEQKSLFVFYLIGWVFPIVPTATYAIYRYGWANTKCWVVPEEAWEWVLNGPSLLSLIINALFLINIIRVLVTKLRATHAQEPSQYRKAVRATLVLLPLFGLHFLVTIYRPASSTGVCFWTEIYFYANDILDGIQGFLVALIFCYFNGEVSALLKRTYCRVKEEYLQRGSSGGNGRGHLRNRHGSMGRSVVSTHIYSSVPPSPETNCMAVAVADDISPCTAANLLQVNANGNGGKNTNKKLLQGSGAGEVALYVTQEHGTTTTSPLDSSSV